MPYGFLFVGERILDFTYLLPCDAMLARYIPSSCVCPSVCPSVCLVTSRHYAG